MIKSGLDGVLLSCHEPREEELGLWQRDRANKGKRYDTIIGTRDSKPQMSGTVQLKDTFFDLKSQRGQFARVGKVMRAAWTDPDVQRLLKRNGCDPSTPTNFGCDTSGTGLGA